MWRRVLAACIVVLAVGAGAAAADESVAGRPDLTLRLAADEIEPGSEATLSVSVSNTGIVLREGSPEYEARVTTAREVRIAVATDRLSEPLADAIRVETPDVPVGTVPVGESDPVEIRLSVAAGLAPGTYELPVRVSYSYTALVRVEAGRDPEFVERTRSEIRTLSLTVPSRPRPVVTVAPNQSVTPGETATYSFLVRNNGSRAATAVGVTLQTDNVSALFGSGTTTGPQIGLYVASLAPGESVPRNVTVTVPPTTTPGAYLVRATVNYRDEFGVERTVDGLRVPIVVAATPTGNDTPSMTPAPARRLRPELDVVPAE